MTLDNLLKCFSNEKRCIEFEVDYLFRISNIDKRENQTCLGRPTAGYSYAPHMAACKQIQ